MATADSFGRRFYRCLSPIQILFKMMGLWFILQPVQQGKIYRHLPLLTCAICFLIRMMADIYFFENSVFHLLIYALSSTNDLNSRYSYKEFTRIDAFGAFFDRFSLLLCQVMTYALMATTIQPTVRMLFVILEPMDQQMNGEKSPDLSPVRRCAIAAVIWTLTQVNIRKLVLHFTNQIMNLNIQMCGNVNWHLRFIGFRNKTILTN